MDAQRSLACRLDQVTHITPLNKVQRLECLCVKEAMRTCSTGVMEIMLDLTLLHLTMEEPLRQLCLEWLRTELEERCWKVEELGHLLCLGPEPNTHSQWENTPVSFIFLLRKFTQ